MIILKLNNKDLILNYIKEYSLKLNKDYLTFMEELCKSIEDHQLEYLDDILFELKSLLKISLPILIVPNSFLKSL